MSSPFPAQQPFGSWDEQLLNRYNQHMAQLKLGPAALGYREAAAKRLLQRLVGKDWHSPTIASDLSDIDRYESGFCKRQNTPT